MQKNQYFPITLIAVAILSGCSSVPPQNAALTEAHDRYNSARANSLVTTQAALELKEAGDSLNKADDAFSKGQGTDTVNHLSYIANQKVGIAQETAKRKTSESVVTNAGVKREQIRLEARTAEADAAKQQVAIVQETANRQAADLVAADAELAAADSALVAADAKAERDQAYIDQQERQLKELSAKKTDRGLVITLGDVLFSTNKAQLESGGMRNVQKLADFLKQYPQQKVLVEGFTDSTGSDSYNQGLSERRANAVRLALLDMGVSSDRVAAHGYGEAFPVGGNETTAGRQLNRRVEIIISDNKGNIAQR